MQVILQLVITFERIQWITYRSYILIALHSALFQWKTRKFKFSPIYIENLTLCSQFVHLYTQVILAHVVHVHACFNAKFFLIAVPGWNFELLVTAGVLFVFFSRLKKLVALKKLWYFQNDFWIIDLRRKYLSSFLYILTFFKFRGYQWR